MYKDELSIVSEEKYTTSSKRLKEVEEAQDNSLSTQVSFIPQVNRYPHTGTQVSSNPQWLVYIPTG